MGPAGHDAGPAVAVEDRIAVAGDAPAGHHHADELLRRAVLGNARQRLTPDEVARLVELDHPAETRLERVRLAIELVAVQGHAGLKAQGVAGAETTGDDAGILAGRRVGLPDVRSATPVDEDLEAVLARVARPRHVRAEARDLAL